MRRVPVLRAPTPTYPDLVCSPWALGLLAAGGLALGAATFGSSGCRTPGDPVQVEPVPTPGEAPRVEPEQPQGSEPAPGTIPEVAPDPDLPRTPGTPREPAPPATEPIPPVPPEVPAVVRPPQEERLGGDMPRPEQPEPAEQ
ncbi:MAG: hypothetical protein ABIO70_19520 [Pseudomonadota bacterium]